MSASMVNPSQAEVPPSTMSASMVTNDLQTSEMCRSPDRVLEHYCPQEEEEDNYKLRVILSAFRADVLKSKQHKLERIDGLEIEKSIVWIKLLVNSEKELRERTVMSLKANSISWKELMVLKSRNQVIELVQLQNIPIARYWLPAGVEQMKEWVSINQEWVQNQLKFLRFVTGYKVYKACFDVSIYHFQLCWGICGGGHEWSAPTVAKPNTTASS
ncbi:hypothetical protein NE237_000232 [Protea cynaroides]|uniref:Uncharacterized protein n=1 Tax=Protea cynaroides TaxID=273540 RepID=A0A9Q0KRV1_9MAGN|nr:hypothetical protein NE237_000232 [Protea cynaroides]